MFEYGNLCDEKLVMDRRNSEALPRGINNEHVDFLDF